MPYLPPSSVGEEPTVPEDLSPHQRPELASFRGKRMGEGREERGMGRGGAQSKGRRREGRGGRGKGRAQSKGRWREGKGEGERRDQERGIKGYVNESRQEFLYPDQFINQFTNQFIIQIN